MFAEDDRPMHLVGLLEVHFSRSKDRRLGMPLLFVEPLEPDLSVNDVDEAGPEVNVPDPRARSEDAPLNDDVAADV